MEKQVKIVHKEIVIRKFRLFFWFLAVALPVCFAIGVWALGEAFKPVSFAGILIFAAQLITLPIFYYKLIQELRTQGQILLKIKPESLCIPALGTIERSRIQFIGFAERGKSTSWTTFLEVFADAKEAPILVIELGSTNHYLLKRLRRKVSHLMPTRYKPLSKREYQSV